MAMYGGVVALQQKVRLYLRQEMHYLSLFKCLIEVLMISASADAVREEVVL